MYAACAGPLRTRAIPERLSGVFMTKRYTNPRLPYLTLPYTMSRENRVGLQLTILTD